MLSFKPGRSREQSDSTVPAANTGLIPPQEWTHSVSTFRTWWRSARAAVSLQRQHTCCVLTSLPRQDRRNDLIFLWELFHMFIQKREASKTKQSKIKKQPANHSSALPAAHGAALPVGSLSPRSQLNSTKRWMRHPLLARVCGGQSDHTLLNHEILKLSPLERR